MRLSIAVVAVFTALLTDLQAQTYVVDAQNGPGAHYTSLPAAIAAVPDGAVLLVRPGGYQPATVDAKGLSILATAPGVVLGVSPFPIQSVLTVRNLAAHQSVIVRGVSLSDFGMPVRTSFQNCRGPILVDRLTYLSNPTERTVLFPIAVDLDACASVTIRDSRIRAFTCVQSRNSTVAIEGCDLDGNAAFSISHASSIAGSGVTIEGGSVTTSRCRVTGGNGLFVGTFVAQPAPAIRLFGGELRITDDASGAYSAGRLLGAAATPVVGGTHGTVVRDPSPTVTPSNGAPVVVAPLTDVVKPLPSLRTLAGPPGGTVTVDVTTPIGEPVLLAISLPGTPTQAQGVDGQLWLAAPSLLVVTVGVPQPGAPMAFTIPVPAVPTLVAFRFTWQAIAWNPNDGLRASNASTYAH
jgi:hypothetical protein